MGHQRSKSFNEPFAPRALRGGTVALALAVAACVALACWWPTLRAAVWDAMAPFSGGSAMLADLEPPQGLDGTGSGPEAALAAIGLDGTALAMGCAVTVAAFAAMWGWSELAAWRSLHDGTWVGGSRSGVRTHGDAWLESRPSALRRATYGWVPGKAPEGGNLVVGELGSSVRLVDAVHAALLAGSGGGKSRRVIIETLCVNVCSGNSVMVNDVKGELRAFTEAWVRSRGTHDVVAVRFDAPAGSMRFDPLARAGEALASGGAGAATRELRELARCVVPQALSGQPFFSDGARNVFVGLCLFVLSNPVVPDECRNLRTVQALLAPTDGSSPVERVASLAASLGPGDPALPFLAGVSGDGGGGQGIISTLQNYLVEFADEDVSLMLHDNEVDLAAAGRRPTVVYVSSSSATGNRDRLVQAFWSQALSALRVEAAVHGGRLPVRTMLLLDEFAAIGKIDRLLRDLGEIRSAGLSVVCAFQSLNQLESRAGYTKAEAETVLDLLGDKVILSVENVETARKLSDSMGTYGATTRSQSRSRGANTSSAGSSESVMRRPLISPDELMRWTAKGTGALVMRGSGTLALPSRDVTETFLGRELGMTSPEAERAMMEAALVDGEIRNAELPPVWDGTGAAAIDADEAPKAKASIPSVPVGF